MGGCLIGEETDRYSLSRRHARMDASCARHPAEETFDVQDLR